MTKKFLFALVATALVQPLAYGANKNARPVSNKDAYQREKVADKQSLTERDVEITRQIREQIVAQDILSTKAKNIKIITQEGHVTLKGFVGTGTEKTTVENIARAIAGDANVTNETAVER